MMPENNSLSKTGLICLSFHHIKIERIDLEIISIAGAPRSGDGRVASSVGADGKGCGILTRI
jgi:hypothetical protein